MCFSATASFSLSTALISTGIFSTVTAYNTNKNYLFLALIPIIFGVQQGIEGLIWCQLDKNSNSTLSFLTYLYLFFAFYFWPFYMPLCTYFIEKKAFQKKLLRRLIFAGATLGVIIYAPILVGAVSAQASIIGHCIQYAVYQSPPLIYTYTICYLLIILMSLLLSSISNIKLLGLAVLISAIVSYWWYFHAFTSIWCFFAAALSIYIAHIVHQLRKTPTAKINKIKTRRR